MNAHVHEASSWPASAHGWAVCSCGATTRVENGKPTGEWHACALCCSEPAATALGAREYAWDAEVRS